MEKKRHSVPRYDYFNTEEERPLVEFPALIKLFLIFFSVGLGLSLLVLPWTIVLLLFVGMFFSIGIMINPFIGVLLFLLSTFVHFLASAAPEIVRMQPAVMAGVVILLSWAFHVMIYRDFKMPKNKQLLYFLGLVVCSAFSVLLHEYYIYFTVLNFVKVLILYLLVIVLVRTEQQFLIILFMAFFLNLYSAGYGIVQQFFGRGGMLLERVTGLEGNPNYFSMNLILLVPFTLGLFQYYRSPLKKILIAGAFVAFMLAIVFSFSRAGALGLTTVLALSIWKFFLKENKFHAIFIFLIILCMVIIFLPGKYWERIESITNLRDVSIMHRVDGVLVGIEMMKQHPVVGVGIGRWKYEYWPVALLMPHIDAKFSTTPHNVFIEVGTNLGVIGLTFFTLMIISAFKQFKKAQKIFVEHGKPLLALTADSFWLGLIGFLICSMFAAVADLKIFWIIIALSVVLNELAQQIRREKEEANAQS
ncbi:MAG: hypothetical protein GY853_05165 [PVC group bacterium]|nr:hypothetical protein [PVC group bacterium]